MTHEMLHRHQINPRIQHFTGKGYSQVVGRPPDQRMSVLALTRRISYNLISTFLVTLEPRGNIVLHAVSNGAEHD